MKILKYFFAQFFFGKVEKKIEHQGRKISLRIEWDHSQPLRTTLNGVIPNIVQIFLIALNAICLFKGRLRGYTTGFAKTDQNGRPQPTE